MLRKRIVFALIYSSNNFNQSRNFRLQKVGDISWLENNYKFHKISHSIDELIIIDASRDSRSIVDFSIVVKKIVSNVFIPICAGGGIRSIDDAKLLFQNGADKIVVNTILYKKPEIVRELIKIYGSQSIVAGIDYKVVNDLGLVFIENGQEKISMNLVDYLSYVQSLGVGEIYLNSIDKDGTGFGYDLKTVNSVSKSINIPLIISGGAGNEKHLYDGIVLDEVSAVATANLFNFMGDGLPIARKSLLARGINLAVWQNF